MEIKTFLSNAIENEPVDETIRAIERAYEPLKISSREAKCLVSAMQDDPIFFDDDSFYRLLSIQEVLDAETDMNVDFREMKILPCIDCGENDYISYDFEKCSWCKFNIAEEFKYATKNSIFEYFNK